MEDGFGGGATEAGLNANEELTLVGICSLVPKSACGRELCWPPRRCRLRCDVWDRSCTVCWSAGSIVAMLKRD